MEFKISGYSTALFSTWFFIEDLDLLFDVGDGVSALLLQKSRNVKNIFISHADRDHLSGLLQFNQLNARDGLPKIYYPKDSGSFPALADFMGRFDPHVVPASWKGIDSNEEIQISNHYFVSAFLNEHILVDPGLVKSLSYLVSHKKSKLKKEFAGLKEEEIKNLALSNGKDFITDIISKKVLAYSGDTPIGNEEKWDGVDILIHEATFLNMQNIVENNAHKHSLLEDVIKMVSELKIGKLILTHFSVRYDHEEIDNDIKKYCKKYKLQCPVYRILPGQFVKNILAGDPLN